MGKHRKFREGDDVYFDKHKIYRGGKSIILNGKYVINNIKIKRYYYGHRGTLYYFINTIHGVISFDTIKHFLNSEQFSQKRLKKINKIIKKCHEKT